MSNWMTSTWQALAQIAAPDTPSSGVVTPPTAADGMSAAPAPDMTSTAPAPDVTSAAPAPALPPLDAPVDPAVLDVPVHGGVLDFIQQSDFVGQGLFGILLLMSLASWYFILYKSISNWRTKLRTNRFLHSFWSASSLEEVEQEISRRGAHDPFSHLANQAIHARKHHAAYGATNLEAAGSTSAFITRTIRKCIDEQTSKLENGLTVLASVGSTAPFVGLFGTVWGVYHALINIGMADGVTVNRIAGPVGEALIMTGLGLAVAIPAVLAYNFFVRGNRVYLGRLDAFAHDLFTFLTTGQQYGRNAKSKRQVTPATEG